jgi:hypothetical protein
MTKLFVLVVALAACGGSQKAPGTGTGASGQTGVDPTVPSWAPASCKAYQKAAFQAANCEAIEQSKRDEIQASYDSASASWKAEQNATDARIAEVDQACTSSTESVRSAIGELCTPVPQ